MRTYYREARILCSNKRDLLCESVDNKSKLLSIDTDIALLRKRGSKEKREREEEIVHVFSENELRH